MKFPVFPVLGAFLFVAVFSPFVLMFAGAALIGNADAVQVGLYLLLHVNPVAIPFLLFLLGIAWAFQRWTTSPLPAKSGVATVPDAPQRAYRPVVAGTVRRTAAPRDVVIDVMAVPRRAPHGHCDGPRLPAPNPQRLAIAPSAGKGATSR